MQRTISLCQIYDAYGKILKKIGKMQKRKKGHKSPQGGWGMDSKEPIQNYFLSPLVTIS